MSAGIDKGATAALAEWAAGFRLDDAPDAVIGRMKALGRQHAAGSNPALSAKRSSPFHLGRSDVPIPVGDHDFQLRLSQ